MRTELKRKPAYSQRRADITLAFLREHMPAVEVVLDIAEPNMTGEVLSEQLGVETHNTYGDLNYALIAPGNSYRAVWMFEVIEHLMNPLLCLGNIHSITTDDVDFFLSYPSRPKWLWNDKDHFHEYDSRRWNLLLEESGWQVVRKKPVYLFHRKIGIRPIIRNFLPVTTIYQLRKR